MALRAVPDHPKFALLKALLKMPKGPTAGYLEMTWHFCGRFTPHGNIGKYSDEQIESWVEWDGEQHALINALIESGWLDRSEEYRLIVHDWHIHADNATKLAVKRSGRSFIEPFSTVSPQCVDSVTTVCGLPEPEPVPEPVPEPELEQKTFAPSSSELNAVIPLGTIPCAGVGQEWPYAEEDVRGWGLSYPGVDVPQQLRNMREWSISNPQRRKTQRGMRAFVTSWLAREQNKPQMAGGSNAISAGKPAESPTSRRIEGMVSALRSAAAAKGYGPAAAPAGANSRGQPQPGLELGDADVPGALRTFGSEVRH